MAESLCALVLVTGYCVVIASYHQQVTQTEKATKAKLSKIAAARQAELRYWQ